MSIEIKVGRAQAMLIEFKVTNYRSFRETQTLSMIASTAKEHTENNTIDPGTGEKLGRAVRSAVVYGPNAAGKTNLIRAFQFMQSLVTTSALVPPTTPLPYDPFKLSCQTRKAPSEFEITFIQNGIRYEYGFSIGSERIHREWLIDYPRGRPRRLFERDSDQNTDDKRWYLGPFLRGNRQLWRDSTRPNSLFLSTAVQLNSDQLIPVFEWFQKRLVVIFGNQAINVLPTIQLLGQPTGKSRLLPFVREADPTIADLEVQREPWAPTSLLTPSTILEPPVPGSPVNIVKVSLFHPSMDDNDPVRLNLSEESGGTQALFRRAGAWLNVLTHGQILLFDEIDTSLHPLLTRFLIEQFHSDVSNPHNAQLIFNTHATSLLNKDLFRRDQIWFVDRDEERATKLFSLQDFSPRSDEAIEKWYLRGRYGALPILTELPPTTEASTDIPNG